MRFDELILQDPDGELRVRFHPELTVLSGLGSAERRALADSILGALVTGREATTVRYTDGKDRTVTIVGEDGRVTAHLEDGSPAPAPLGALGADAVAVRSLMLLGADDLGVVDRAARADEPPDLQEARATLEQLTAELTAALGSEQAAESLQHEIDEVEVALRAAHDEVARREYAQVLAQLERVRAEAAAVQAGAAGIEADRHLLTSADSARSLAQSWQEAKARVDTLAALLAGHPGLEQAERDRLARVPEAPPENLDEVVASLQRAIAERAALDHRLQELSVSKLPAPSDPLVAELGLLDQDALWAAGDRLVDATQAMQSVQVSLGGLEVDDMGPAPSVIAEIEAAHTRAEDAERAAASARVPGIAGSVAGLGIAAAGFFTVALVIPVGFVITVVALVAGIVRPKARRAATNRAERSALERADAPSYLAFHIRRVDASVDPKLRALVETTTSEQRAAVAAWGQLTGDATDVGHAQALRVEIEAYNEALRNLGDTADEIEQLRRELEGRAGPAASAIRDDLLRTIEPYQLGADYLEDLTGLRASVLHHCELGAAARALTELDEAEVDDQKASSRLEDLLLQLGFDAGPLDARVGALEWAVTRAAEREDARAHARPVAELDAELQRLQESAANLRRPEWAAVTADDATTPDIPELEARRSDLINQLTSARAEVDVGRLADRQAAVERRVAALEARYGGHEASGDPGAIADIQQHLLAHLARASDAGPDKDPVPVLLDEVFLRVPADRKWDLLDLLHRFAESHQLVYLSDDAFVAAWARQRALDGTITLLELAPEAG